MPLKNFSKNFSRADRIITKENIVIPQSPAASPKLLDSKDKLESLVFTGNSKSHKISGTKDKIDKIHQPEF